MVIYKDLYDVIEKTSFFKDYVFKKISESEVHNEESKYPFSVYSINKIYNANREKIEIDNKKIQEHIKKKQIIAKSTQFIF